MAGEVPTGLHADLLAVKPKKNGSMEPVREAPSCGYGSAVALQCPLLTKLLHHVKWKKWLQGLTPGSQSMTSILCKTSLKVGP